MRNYFNAFKNLRPFGVSEQLEIPKPFFLRFNFIAPAFLNDLRAIENLGHFPLSTCINTERISLSSALTIQNQRNQSLNNFWLEEIR